MEPVLLLQAETWGEIVERRDRCASGGTRRGIVAGGGGGRSLSFVAVIASINAASIHDNSIATALSFIIIVIAIAITIPSHSIIVTIITNTITFTTHNHHISSVRSARCGV